MNRIYLTLAALALLAASEAQAFHPCRVQGGTQSFSVAPAQSVQSYSFVQPQVQSFSFVQPQVQSFNLVPQVQAFSFVQSQGLNQNNNTSGNTGNADSQALLSPALLSTLRIACNLVGANVGSNPNPNTTELATLTNEIKALRDDQKTIMVELKKLNAKAPKTPAKATETTPDPKKKLGEDKKTDGSKTSVQTISQFKQLREQAERLASSSVPTEVVVSNASK